MIAIVVVNWNGWQDTLRAYQSVAASDYANWCFVAVDNGSTDGSATRLAEAKPGFELIAHPTNEGFAGGCNVGIRAALARGAEFVLLLNNDATVASHTLRNFVSAARETGEAVLGGLVRYKETRKLQFFGSARSPLTGAPLWFDAEADRRQLDKALIESDFAFGAALFAPASLWRRIGLFDERFFLTYEETDWCYRARAAGAGCFVVRDAEVEHVGGATLGSAMSPLQAYFLQRNRLLFYEKHAGARLFLRGFRADLRAVWLAAREDRQQGGLTFTRRAQMRAISDFILRRFGDCPTEIRRLAAAARVG